MFSRRAHAACGVNDMEEYNDYLRVCEEAVRAGARVVQDWIGRTETREKGPADLVTQADLASQETVRRVVLGAFPNHCLLGEEQEQSEPEKGTGTFCLKGPKGASHKRCLSPFPAEYRWIVDPLDGTTNFVHGVPHYCVSLALERNGELLVGAVYDPMLDECFTAATGQGARLGGRAIHASGVSKLSEALAAVGFPPGVRSDSPDLRMFLEMIPRCQAIRRTGSAALNLCYLAAGRFDLFWSFSTHIWDVAAGVLILREAGGCVTSPDGGPFHLEEADFLAAANPELLAQLREIAATITE
ncbi:MAG: inositol monophosphatase [Planctomycetales bacterium]|nr:inositol monophosphatase [Planctomycetales bacterium]